MSPKLTIAAVVLALVVVLYCATSGYWRVGVSAVSELPFKQAEFGQVVDAHASGSLSDEQGVITLPPSLASLVCSGRVYVTRNDSGGVAFLFVVWRGKGSNLHGYLYLRGTWPSIPTMVGGSTTIAVIGPAVDGSSASMDAGEIQIEIQKMRQENWYTASRDLD